MYRLYGSLKIIGFAVLLLIGISIVYAGFMSIKYWSGIAV